MEKKYQKTCMYCGRRFWDELERGNFCSKTCRNAFRHAHNTWPSRHQSTSRVEDRTLLHDGAACVIDREE